MEDVVKELRECGTLEKNPTYENFYLPEDDQDQIMIWLCEAAFHHKLDLVVQYITQHKIDWHHLENIPIRLLCDYIIYLAKPKNATVPFQQIIYFLTSSPYLKQEMNELILKLKALCFWISYESEDRKTISQILQTLVEIDDQPLKMRISKLMQEQNESTSRMKKFKTDFPLNKTIEELVEFLEKLKSELPPPILSEISKDFEDGKIDILTTGIYSYNFVHKGQPPSEYFNKLHNLREVRDFFDLSNDIGSKRAREVSDESDNYEESEEEPNTKKSSPSSSVDHKKHISSNKNPKHEKSKYFSNKIIEEKQNKNSKGQNEQRKRGDDDYEEEEEREDDEEDPNDFSSDEDVVKNIRSFNDFQKSKSNKVTKGSHRGTYSEEEVDAFLDGYKKFGNSWSEVQRSDPILKNRSQTSIKDFYRNLVKHGRLQYMLDNRRKQIEREKGIRGKSQKKHDTQKDKPKSNEKERSGAKNKDSRDEKEDSSDQEEEI